MHDIGIVLGHRLGDDGRASRTLEARLNKCLELYKKGIFDLIIVTGGQANGNAPCAESTVMKEFLVAHGVSPEAITEESSSKTTFQNAKYCKRILKDREYGIIYLITSVEHIKRPYLNPRRLFRLFGLRTDCKYSYECTVTGGDNG